MKRFIALMLSLLLLCLGFAGCTNNDDKPSETTQSTPATIDFTYDSYYKFDNSVIRLYEEMCQAVVDRQTELRFNQSIYKDVSQLLFTSFPLVDLIEQVQINHDMSGLTISYKYDEAQHKQLVNDFVTKIDQIKTACKFGEVSTNEYIINVYNYVASNIQLSQNSAITVFETITTGQGTSFTYSRMFEYILQQSGVQTSHVIAFDKNDATWGTSIVVIDNSYYYCDVTKEFNDNGGTKLKFFGMTTADANDCGLSNFKYSDSAEIVTPFDDDRFSACRNGKSYSIADNVLTVIDGNSVSTEISLDTPQNEIVI